jgi:hypothetical protein
MSRLAPWRATQGAEATPMPVYALTHKHEYGVPTRLFRANPSDWFDLDCEPTPALVDVLAELGVDYRPQEGEELFLDEVDGAQIVDLEVPARSK